MRIKVNKKTNVITLFFDLYDLFFNESDYNRKITKLKWLKIYSPVVNEVFGKSLMKRWSCFSWKVARKESMAICGLVDILRFLTSTCQQGYQRELQTWNMASSSASCGYCRQQDSLSFSLLLWIRGKKLGKIQPNTFYFFSLIFS